MVKKWLEIVPTPTSHDSNSWIAYFKTRPHFITSKDFDTSIQSPVKTEDKTEVKTEVKTENFEDFEMWEQAVIDFITSNDY